MQTSNSTHFKIPHILLSLLFTIITIFIIFNSTPLTVHASQTTSGGAGGNGTGSQVGGSNTRTDLVEGVSNGQQFWLLYLTNDTGEVISDVAMYVDFNKYISKVDKDHLKVRKPKTVYLWDIEQFTYEFPEPTIIKDVGSNGEPPFGWSWGPGDVPRGSEVKQFLISNNPDTGRPWAFTIIEQIWGEDMARLMSLGKVCLVLENGMYCGYYDENGNYAGYVFGGTAYGWANYNYTTGANSLKYGDSQSLDGKGSYMINRYTNGVLPHSSKLEFTQIAISI